MIAIGLHEISIPGFLLKPPMDVKFMITLNNLYYITTNMKIRNKGNSLRIRLSKSEVNQLAGEGYMEEQTSFGNNALVYALQTSKEVEQ